MLGCIAAFLFFAADDADALPLDKAPPAVKAYIQSAEKLRPERAKEMQSILRNLERPARKVRMSAAEKKARSENIKGTRAMAKRLADPNDFVPISEAPGGLAVGFCGRIELWEFRGGHRPTSTGRVVQVIDDTNLIVETGKHLCWVSGRSTKKTVDGSTISLDGAWHISGTKTYETVVGGTKTILLLEPFDEHDALPYLPPKQREKLKDWLDGAGEFK